MQLLTQRAHAQVFLVFRLQNASNHFLPLHFQGSSPAQKMPNQFPEYHKNIHIKLQSVTQILLLNTTSTHHFLNFNEPTLNKV